MTFRTITAKFAGTCKRCNGPIKAGERIRYDTVRRSTYHFAADCAVKTAQPAPQPEPVKMTADLAQTIRRTFDDLLARPVSLLDYEPDTADDSPVDVQPEPARTLDDIVQSSRPTPATTRWREFTKTPSTPYQQRPSIDADLF